MAVLAGLPLLLMTVIAATAVGAVAIPPAECASVILRHLHLPAGHVDTTSDVIVWDVRLPRVLTAALVGAALSVSGTAYQGVFRNPLADPYLIGVAAGASFGAVLAIVSPLPLDFYSFGYVALFAFVGAMLAVGATFELARVGRTVPATTHILAGVAVSAAAGAGTSLLLMLNEDRVFVVFSWLYGNFTTSSWTKLGLISPYVLGAMAFLFLSARHLNALQVGDDEAKSLGIRVERLKVLTIIAASLATAVCVAVSGLIGFVGLVVPHACRMVFGPDHRALFPASLFAGAIFLILADLLARTIVAPRELPVGVLTASIGAPFFLFLLRRQKRSLGL